jgi:uncharacterized membrane protein YkvA (DUF1232 family)
MKRRKNTDLALTGSRGRLYRRCVEKAGKMMPNRERISKTIRKARKIFERLHNLPRCKGLSKNICDFCDLLSDYFDGSYPNLPLSTIVAVLAGLLYLVLPMDAISDFFPLLGYLDDAGVMAFVIATEKADMKEYLTWKEKQLEEKATIIDLEPNEE